MRFVAIALVILSLPIFIALLTQYRDRRDWALFAIGVMLFLVGTLQIDGALITWRLWQGYVRGVFISPVDTLSLALIITRTGKARVHYLWVLLLFALPSLVSIAVSYMPMASFFVTMQVLRIALMFYALAGELHRPSAMRSLFGGVAVGLMIQGGYVIQQKLSGVVQARGTADHQNILGMMVELAAIPLLALVLEGDKRKLLYAGLIAALVIVAGGGSRGTMAFVAAGLALATLLSVMRRMTPRKGKLLGVAVMASLLVVPLGLATLKDRFGDRSVTVLDEQRPAFERAARAMAADHPLGVGANTYVMIANEQGYSQRAGVSWGGNNLAAPVHNSFLLMRAEMGWFGEIVMFLVIAVFIIGGLRTGFSEKKQAMVGMALGAATSGIVIAFHANYEYAWHLEVVQRLFFVNLAVLSACVALTRQTKFQRLRERRERARSAQVAST